MPRRHRYRAALAEYQDVIGLNHG
ncbi:hypothetical protein YPPY90_4535, partial [Yersinia pestis PY-90]